jgi:glucose-1-phosphate adenylyltransferase
MHPQDDELRYVSRLTRETMALVLAGGRGSRLHELTSWRAKPALYFGGKYRIIDFPLSNCVNSGIRKIGVLTQYKAHSLVRHLVEGWSHFKRELGEYVEILPASQRFSDDWYRGTADAIFQNLDILHTENPRYILVLAGDHIFKMDYGPMLVAHEESGADMTVSCLEVPIAEAANTLGVMRVDGDNRVIGFEEKPAKPSPLPGRDDVCLASMGNYVCSADFLFGELVRDADDATSSHDFGHDIIPASIGSFHVNAYPFRNPTTGERAYWRDVGTLDSFWKANMELVAPTPPLNLYDREWPVWTRQVQLPPAKFVFNDDDRRGMAVDSMVSAGCIVSGARLQGSVLFSDVVAHSWSEVEDSVVLPGVQIGRYAKVRKAIIDRNCEIPRGMEIGFDPQADREQGFRVTDSGVTLVTRSMLGQPGGGH